MLTLNQFYNERHCRNTVINVNEQQQVIRHGLTCCCLFISNYHIGAWFWEIVEVYISKIIPHLTTLREYFAKFECIVIDTFIFGKIYYAKFVGIYIELCNFGIIV